jgi:hypothetical protein
MTNLKTEDRGIGRVNLVFSHFAPLLSYYEIENQAATSQATRKKYRFILAAVSA